MPDGGQSPAKLKQFDATYANSIPSKLRLLESKIYLLSVFFSVQHPGQPYGTEYGSKEDCAQNTGLHFLTEQ